MAEKPDLARISVAVIGVGPIWEQHYRAAVLRLSSKIRVKAICDPVHMRAVAVAEEFRAAAVMSPWELAQHRDLHAWLILDPGWFGTYPAALAVRGSRPALLANVFSHYLPQLVTVLRESLECGESLMPEFPARFMPSTTRLRELMATKLGAVQKIEIQIVRSPGGSPTTTEWLHGRQAEVAGLFDC